MSFFFNWWCLMEKCSVTLDFIRLRKKYTMWSKWLVRMIILCFSQATIGSIPFQVSHMVNGCEDWDFLIVCCRGVGANFALTATVSAGCIKSHLTLVHNCIFYTVSVQSCLRSVHLCLHEVQPDHGLNCFFCLSLCKMLQSCNIVLIISVLHIQGSWYQCCSQFLFVSFSKQPPITCTSTLTYVAAFS